jgi:predicted ATPase
LNPKRIVITGGPGTGKSTLIKLLEKSGYLCLHEVSREVILQARKEGHEQLFLNNPLLFSEKLIEGRLEQFRQVTDFKQDILFYDRGLHDVIAYLNYIDSPFPKKMHQACENHCYDLVFILPPWREIYTTDNERYESFREAEKIHFHLENTYINYNYTPIEVPKLTAEQRLSFILDQVKSNL